MAVVFVAGCVLLFHLKYTESRSKKGAADIYRISMLCILQDEIAFQEVNIWEKGF